MANGIIAAFDDLAASEAESEAEVLALSKSNARLIAAIEDLLNCAELNQDDLEDETRKSIEQAIATTAAAKGEGDDHAEAAA